MFSEEKKDDFWDLYKLLPKKKRSILTPFSTKEKTFIYEIKSSDGILHNSLAESDKSLTLGENAQALGEEEYVFSDGIVRNVKIKKMLDKYDFYSNFRKSALLYYDVPGNKCDFVPFFSYMPQYSQLDIPAKQYYFYWRDMIRRGKYIKTDYSYIYLYVYEILNLPDKIPAEQGIHLLTSLWRAYRQELPNIDSSMSLWLQDYCFVHKLKCPINEIREFIYDVISVAEFKEFYLSDITEGGDNAVSALLAYLSDYDWRRGKYAGGEHREIYEKHMISAMRRLISEIWRSGEVFQKGNFESETLTRSAFRGSLCTHSVKCKLEIEYIPLSRAEALRRGVSSAVKYAENKLRALIGVKSRLSVKDLPDEYKEIIDGYFTAVFDKARHEREIASMPEYEKMYDANSTGLSFDGAGEIEKSSWATTVRLVADSDDEIEIISANSQNIKENAEQKNIVEKNKYGLYAGYVELISALCFNNAEKLDTALLSIGTTLEEAVNVINEAFSDNFGDIIITEDMGEYSIIEDYREDIEQWLTK